MPLFQHLRCAVRDLALTTLPAPSPSNAHEDSLLGGFFNEAEFRSSQPPPAEQVLPSDYCAARTAAAGVPLGPATARANGLPRLQKIITIHSLVFEAIKDPVANNEKNMVAVQRLRDEGEGAGGRSPYDDEPLPHQPVAAYDFSSDA